MISIVLLTSVAALLGGCGDDDAPVPLTGLVLTADAFPTGFSIVPASVGDMVEANESTLKQAQSVAFSPAECKPTADAEFNPQLNEENTVLVVGQSDAAVLSEVVSTVARNVDADRRATTGPCRVVTASPTTGSLAGARLVTTTEVLKSPTAEAVEQALVVRQNTVTTLADGGVRASGTLLATLLVRRSGGSTVTVQLSAGTSGDQVTPAGQAPKAPSPMDDVTFGKLVDEAVARASR